MTTRQMAWAGLVLLGLALLTYQRERDWNGDVPLWTAQQETVRAHVNARQAYLEAGQPMEAINECSWLLHAAATGLPVSPLPWQVRDIHRICLSPSSSQ